MNEIEKLLDKKEVKGFRKDLKKWLKPFKKKIAVEMAMSFECVITKPKIYVDIVRDLKQDNTMDNLHKELYKEKGFDFQNELNFYTFAFLHELGHIMTVRPKDFETEIENFHYEMGDLLTQDHVENPKLLLETYMDTEFERKANNWAYRFWELNKDYCKELENILIRYSIESI